MTLDKIYQEDCIETLKKLEDNSIDLIITSPPYNKGYWSKNRNPRNGFHTKSRRIDYGVYDDCMPPEEYERWQREILDECVRVIKPDGSIWYNHKEILSGRNAVNPTYIYDYPLVQTIIWNRKNTPVLDKRYFFPTTEWLYWIKKDKSAKPFFDKGQAIYKNVIWEIAPDVKNNHPAPFPIEIPENIILACSRPGDVVYDPFMGSGTVAIAAKTHDRHYLGSELSPEYVEDAEKRIKEETTPPHPGDLS